MKRIYRILLLAILIFALHATPAYANQQAALNLQQLSLFRGSDKGFELERVPNRAEASVMLIRLLGKEQEALTANYTHPFTDLIGYESPYVGYLYRYGLTRGTGAHSFSPRTLCDQYMYCTFVLRALDYNEAYGDFSYWQADQFASELGLYQNDGGVFDRGQMAAVSYTALATRLKDSELTLLDTLVAAGAVNAEAAAPYQQLFAGYDEVTRLFGHMQELNSLEVSISCDIQQGANQRLRVDGELSIAGIKQAAADPLALQAALKAAATISALYDGRREQISQPFELYYRNGNIYVKTVEQEQELKIMLPMQQMLHELNNIGYELTADENAGAPDLYSALNVIGGGGAPGVAELRSVEQKHDGSGDYYQLVYYAPDAGGSDIGCRLYYSDGSLNRIVASGSAAAADGEAADYELTITLRSLNGGAPQFPADLNSYINIIDSIIEQQ
ncbi:MAG: hypothetical protein Q4B96_02570 [Bacillota bacterium]|nr:hypothetical protein [Bacillota bacterium]